MPQRVLVVDDNTDLRVISRRLLEKNGFVVDEAANGERALQQLRAQPYDVVLLDIMMPEMSGLDVLRMIRGSKETREIPVVMVTAKNDDTDVLAGYERGADYYLTKPYTPDHLLYTIGLVLGRPELSPANR